MRQMLLASARRAWRLLPQGFRSRLILGAIDLALPGATAAARIRPGPIAVAGLFGSASGIGESARLCLEALQDLGLDAKHTDFTSFLQKPDLAAPLPAGAADAAQGGTVIVHINSPAVPYVAFRLGRHFLSGRRVIGCWVWELPSVPPDWRRGFRHVHEIWVPSRFVADALPRASRIPVKIVPYPVRTPEAAPSRDRFGLPADAFIVMTAFDMQSGYVRKNPKAAIAAFRRAFGNDSGCLLLLKVGHSAQGGWATEDLNEAIAGMGNVRMIRETLTRADVSALTASLDAVLSLHRAEGFGLVLAEAMLLGVPVIATGWSGNVDFMTHDDSALVSYRLVPVEDPNGPYKTIQDRWAEPDIDEAAAWLRRLRADADLRRALGERGRKAASERLSLAAYRRAIGDSLDGDQVRLG